MAAAMVLNPVLGKLVSKRVVLASASPRRQEILTNVVSEGLMAGGPLASRGQGSRPGPLQALRGARAAAAWRRVGTAGPLPPVSSRGLVPQGGHKPELGLPPQLGVLVCLGGDGGGTGAGLPRHRDSGLRGPAWRSCRGGCRRRAAPRAARRLIDEYCYYFQS